MHKVASPIEDAVPIPLLDIADATGRNVTNSGLKTVGLLGTRFTMEQDFYRKRLEREHGLTVLVPSEGDREIVHRVIYDELCLGKVLDASREHYRRIIRDLVDHGAQAIILGCTEIAMLVDQGCSSVPLFDTTAIHARAAAEWAVSE